MFCRNISAKDRYKERLYKLGVKKIEEEFDIRNINKDLRTLKFISHVLLTKYQRKLIPHFRENLLNYQTYDHSLPSIGVPSTYTHEDRLN